MLYAIGIHSVMCHHWTNCL